MKLKPRTDGWVMTSADAGRASHSARWWLVSLLLLVCGVLYISLFWGRAATLLPGPLDCWGELCYPRIASWKSQTPVLWLGAHVAIGLVAPMLLLAALRRTPLDAGLSWPNVLGRRLTVVGILASIPPGLWLTLSIPGQPPTVSLGINDACALAAMVPEHFLICGTYVALMLPRRRLPHPAAVAPVEGHAAKRVFRWLGLAQPRGQRSNNGLLAWFGLSGASLFAILASGALFGMVHVGKPPLELALSFPGGVAVAYLTLRSHSIWPALLAHWSLNLLPSMLLAVFS